MSHDIGLAVVSHIHDRAVLGIELPYRVVTGNAAVLAEGYDYLVLKYGFGVNNDRLLKVGGDHCRSVHLSTSAMPCITYMAFGRAMPLPHILYSAESVWSLLYHVSICFFV